MRTIDSVSLGLTRLVAAPGRDDLSKSLDSVSLGLTRLVLPPGRDDLSKTVDSVSLSLAGYAVNGTATTMPPPLPPPGVKRDKPRQWRE